MHLTTPTAHGADSETIHTTANHPWLTADRGWVQAGDLKPGEAVVTLDGATSTVAWVQVVPGQADMYNLTVANDHTYAVGDGQTVVHNDDGPPWTWPSLPSDWDPYQAYLQYGRAAEAYEVAFKFNINIRGTQIVYDPLKVSEGGARPGDLWVMRLGPNAFADERTLGASIAHELNHLRNFRQGGPAPEWGNPNSDKPLLRRGGYDAQHDFERWYDNRYPDKAPPPDQEPSC